MKQSSHTEGGSTQTRKEKEVLKPDRMRKYSKKTARGSTPTKSSSQYPKQLNGWLDSLQNIGNPIDRMQSSLSDDG